MAQFIVADYEQCINIILQQRNAFLFLDSPAFSATPQGAPMIMPSGPGTPMIMPTLPGVTVTNPPVPAPMR